MAVGGPSGPAVASIISESVMTVTFPPFPVPKNVPEPIEPPPIIVRSLACTITLPALPLPPTELAKMPVAKGMLLPSIKNESAITLTFPPLPELYDVREESWLPDAKDAKPACPGEFPALHRHKWKPRP